MARAKLSAGVAHQTTLSAFRDFVVIPICELIDKLAAPLTLAANIILPRLDHPSRMLYFLGYFQKETDCVTTPNWRLMSSGLICLIFASSIETIPSSTLYKPKINFKIVVFPLQSGYYCNLFTRLDIKIDVLKQGFTLVWITEVYIRKI